MMPCLSVKLTDEDHPPPFLTTELAYLVRRQVMVGLGKVFYVLGCTSRQSTGLVWLENRTAIFVMFMFYDVLFYLFSCLFAYLFIC